jgi:hypothetical protein
MKYKGWRITKKWDKKLYLYRWYIFKLNRSRGMGPFLSEQRAYEAIERITAVTTPQS